MVNRLFQTITSGMMFCLALLWAGNIHAYDATVDKQLTGTVMCSSNSTKAPNAFDGDASTYYTASSDKFQWVGLDLGSPHVITRISYTPRLSTSGGYNSSYGEQLVLSLFEGANSPDFMDAMPLYLIAEAPRTASATYVGVNVSRGFRYVRYVGGAGSYCNVGELQFFGHEGEGDDTQFYQITNLPTLSIHVKDNILPTNRGEDFESNSVLIYNEGTRVQDFPILFRVRGNYSAAPENKAYRVKYNDGKSHHPMKDSENEAPVKAKKWVLINSYRDKTVMRNPIAWEMSKRIRPNWTPWSQVVDLVVNGDYRGTYTLADHVDVHSGRIDITEMTAEDIEGDALTGGYYVEVDNNAGREPYHFTSSKGNPISVHDPDEDVIQDVQFQYVKDRWNEMEGKIFGNNYADETEGYRSALDLESFLKYFLISEFNGNTDMICQVFMYKERGDDHFYTGPVWDAELALENDITTYPANDRADWTYKVRQTGQWGSVLTRILSDPAAMARLQDMWAEVREDSSVTSAILGDAVDSLRREVRASAKLNFIRWPYLNQNISLNTVVYNDWEKEVDAVREYVKGRVAWMDKKLGYKTLQQSGDMYLINSARDLITFYNIVKSGETSASAKLTNDIDMDKFSDKFTPLGTSANAYCGVFDGGNHVIRNLHLEGGQYTSFFGVVGPGCRIKNLIFDASCSFKGTKNVSAFVGYAKSGSIQFSNCANEAIVEATEAYAAGFAASSRLLATLDLTNCYNTGTITSTNYVSGLVTGALGKVSISNAFDCGQLSGTQEGQQFANSSKDLQLTNCYDLGSGQVTTVTARQVESGELCYMLNFTGGYQLWHQNIDNGRARDAHPVFTTSSGTVYKTDDGRFTNVNANAKNYRYYKLVVNSKQGSYGPLQLSEFDLLDEYLEEVPTLQIYAANINGYGGENWENLTDNSVNTKYCCPFTKGMYMLFDAGKELDIYGYRMYTANDTQSNSDRNPGSWALYASDTYTDDPNSSSWVLIDEQESNTILGATNYTPYDFMIPHSLKSITLNKHDVILPGDDTLQLVVKVEPAAMENMVELKWNSTNPAAASVDEKGLVTPQGVGEADIIVTAPNYGLYADTCHVFCLGNKDNPIDSIFNNRYRYFLMAISSLQNGTTIQLSEFDVLDGKGEEVPELSLYSYTGSAVSNHPQTDLVDNTTTTKYCGNIGNVLYLYFDAGSAINVTGYRMYTANDTDKYPGRNPVSWCFYGSLSQSTDPADACWQLLDERTNDNTLQAKAYTPYDFPIDYSNIIDGISGVSGQSKSLDGVYDLNGRKFSQGTLLNAPSPKNVYIIQGKKVLR